ncbi:hypothetical protein PAECIP111891_01500 [Paenibacillus allorhizoplanae]|uniref:Secreted protein n=1 Tax=Paenibacillus allorhizoplanae TaxID=2905648 RepID=A0ABM9BZU8_9BACL|nr:hypothetical protein [Paenibacillus allorhizoplanae]CAH1200142.1 hypothetical protein PAECIP111891_01500 [Paenibacillus allorhizoplanae]
MRLKLLPLACFVILLSACGSSGTTTIDMSDMSGMSSMTMSSSSVTHQHTSDAIAHFSVDSPNYLPKELSNITILVQNKWNRPIEKFDVMHEKLMHLIVVSKDLSYFEHLHPTYAGAGRFDVQASFPAGGYYQLIADFTPTGLGESVQSHWLTINGKVPKAVKLQPDKSLTKQVGDKEVTLAFDHLMAGMELDMVFTFKQGAAKTPVTNLQPYLGSVGHVVAISEDGNDFVHVHPTDSAATSGPTAAFKIVFPSKGIYKIWGQFQQNNEVFIVPYVIHVNL